MAEPDRILELISPSRRDVLIALRRSGESWAAGLAGELHLSVSALRQTLTTLEGEGLVSSRQVRSGPGRPRMYFRLTEAAENLFHQRQSAVYHILDAVLELASEGREITVETWAQRLGQPTTVEGGRPAGATRPDWAVRLRQAEERLAHDGFAPQIDADGRSASIRLRRCPVIEIARSRPLICELERRALEAELAGPVVERKQYRLAGDDLCVYQMFVEGARDQ